MGLWQSRDDNKTLQEKKLLSKMTTILESEIDQGEWSQVEIASLEMKDLPKGMIENWLDKCAKIEKKSNVQIMDAIDQWEKCECGEWPHFPAGTLKKTIYISFNKWLRNHGDLFEDKFLSEEGFYNELSRLGYSCEKMYRFEIFPDITLSGCMHCGT